MTWYAAHIIMVTRFRDGRQDEFPIEETIVLIEASSDADAHAKAKAAALKGLGDDDTYTYDGRPARREFAGIRKIMKCENDSERPGDGVEISFSSLSVADEDALAKLARGVRRSAATAVGTPTARASPTRTSRSTGRSP